MAESTPTKFQPRGYQLEMLEMSMQRNIIVAMDTGSGKTLVGALRVQSELEKCLSNQRVWFLCPTVALVDQQAIALRRSLPKGFSIIALSGNDGVDHWSSRTIWESVLSSVSVVVCTYQVLLDALMHSFVQLEEIALLVFDEAHHCSGKHPANRILLDHYHPSKWRGGAIPKVLGLTASPVQSIKRGGLDLDAISRTPNQFREEILSYVYIPDVDCMLYEDNENDTISYLDDLKAVYSSMSVNLHEDPWVIFLKEQQSLRYQQKLEDALFKGKTWCMETMRRLKNVADEIFTELGPWATFQYLKQCVLRFLRRQEDDMEDGTEVRRQEFEYMINYLQLLDVHHKEGPALEDPKSLTTKLNLLIDTISQEWKRSNTDPTTIIFVKTRNSVRLLAWILSMHSKTKNILKIGTFVGLSANAVKGANLTELISSKDQEETLDDLRSGKKNVLISTSVCEEGIDVSACNLVICYDAPANLRAFVQRRGRARSLSSKYIIMLASQMSSKLDDWKQAEQLMREQYMDDMRQLQELERLESDEEGYMELVTSKGAKLTLDDSISTLQHFCSQIPQTAFTSYEPIYVFSVHDDKTMDCCVHLPNGLHPDLQRHYSSTQWTTQRLARRDAAFQAMSKLYTAGLINENLMPIHHIDEDARLIYDKIATRPNVILTDEQHNPWLAVAQRWSELSEPHLCRVLVSVSDGRKFEIELISSVEFPEIPQTTLYIDTETTANVEFKVAPPGYRSSANLEQAQRSTHLLFQALVPRKVDRDRIDYPVLCVPANVGDIDAWIKQMSGNEPAQTLLNALPSSAIGVVRDHAHWGARYYYLGTESRPLDYEDASQQNTEAQSDLGTATVQSAEANQPDNPMKALLLKVRKFPRKLDFLHSDTETANSKKSTRHTYVDPTTCTVDRLPVDWTSLAQWVPSINYVVGLYLTAQELATTILSEIPIDRKIMLEAISSGSANNFSNYQRLEFLGDSLLSIQTALAVMTEHPLWHEGYLSRGKHHEVSNSHLSRACIETNLSRFVLTKSFSGSKWRPTYNSDLLGADMQTEREISTKTLADVVEALLGAAWISAGEPAFLKCLHIFVSKRKWNSAPKYLQMLQEVVDETYQGIQLPMQDQILERLKRLLGYKFNRPYLLIEALTHPSYSTALVSTPSYQRLEFLGDSILESIVTERIFSRKGTPVPVHRMHSIRTAAVNGHFLAFCALSYEMDITRTAARIDPREAKIRARRPEWSSAQWDGGPEITFEEVTRQLSLPSFLRVAPDAALRDALNITTTRFKQWKSQINEKLEAEVQYPWTELAAFNAEKVFSDLVESTVAAIAIDQGYFGRAACDQPETHCAVFQWLEKLGIMRWLDRLIENEDFGVMHPKEEVGVLAVDRPVRYGNWVAHVGQDGKIVLPVDKPGAKDHQTGLRSLTTDGKEGKMQHHRNRQEPEHQAQEALVIEVDGFPEQGDKVHCCNIYVNNERVASATGATRMEAETRVAERAVAILRESPPGKAMDKTITQPVQTKDSKESGPDKASGDEEFFDAVS